MRLAEWHHRYCTNNSLTPRPTILEPCHNISIIQVWNAICVCTVFIVSFGESYFPRMLWNQINVMFNLYIPWLKPICYHCEMFSFNWILKILFVSPLACWKTSRSLDVQHSTRMYADHMSRPSILKTLGSKLFWYSRDIIITTRTKEILELDDVSRLAHI